MNVVTKNKFTQFLQNSRMNLVIAVAVAVVVVGVGYFLIRSYAGGIFASITVSQGTTSGNATVVDDATASSGKAVQFNAPAQTGGGGTGGTSSTTCPLPAYPTPSCTGVPASVKIAKTINGDYYAKTDGEVIDSVHITGDLVIQASNVIIKNTFIDGHVDNDTLTTLPNTSFTITDSTVGLQVDTTKLPPMPGCSTEGYPSINGHDFTATRVLLQGHQDGVDVVGNNVKVTDSFIQPCFQPAAVVGSDGFHSDGVQDQCGGVCAHMTFVHNTFDSRAFYQRKNSDPTQQYQAGPVAGYHTAMSGNSAIYLGSPYNGTGQNAADVTLQDNMFLGGGYTTALWWDNVGDKANWVVTNNAWVTTDDYAFDKWSEGKWAYGTWAFGPVDTESNCSHMTWSGNSVVKIDSNYKVTTIVGPQPCVN